MKINEIRNLLGFKKNWSPFYLDGIVYEGVFSSGSFTETSDYGVGLLNISIGNHIDVLGSAVKVTTIDDGIWCGYANKELDLKVISEDFSSNFDTKLPSNKIFNEFFAKYGIYGQDES